MGELLIHLALLESHLCVPGIEIQIIVTLLNSLTVCPGMTEADKSDL